MVRKPNRMYRNIKGQAYTRREYMGGVPTDRISQYTLGVENADYPLILTLKAQEACHIRHIALEAARVAATRVLTKKVAGNAYYMKVRVSPHNVLRENKQATGAGADRVSEGMRRAFGKAVGTAARVKPNQSLITIKTIKENYLSVKEALRNASLKLPTPCKIVIEKGAELVK